MPIRIISSMATKQLLTDLTHALERESGLQTQVESVGGVDAAKRVAAGEPFDIVVLAADAIDKLIAQGNVVEGSRIDLVRSGVSIAVRAGTPHPPIGDEAGVRPRCSPRRRSAIRPARAESSCSSASATGD